SCFHDGFAFAVALLAAGTVIRISCGSEGWRRVGVDFGRIAAHQEDVMKQRLKLAGLAGLFGFVANAAVAQEKLKIGLIVTLSGPAAALGQQVRDGFTLAIKDLGGKMAGREVEVVAADDELKPD